MHLLQGVFRGPPLLWSFCEDSVLKQMLPPSLYPLLGYYELSFSVCNNQMYIYVKFSEY